jgi:GntR family transcriptional repressor for pyruvate dehydrogenase complex
MVQHLGQNTPLRIRLGEQVAELLLAAIRLHGFLPGERLPSERELCGRLGVNRTAVREGLRWLEQQQFIEIRRGKYGGAFVVHTPAEIALERIRGRIPELRELLEYRGLLEPVTAALAAERIGADELARLAELHRREEQELGLTRAQVRAIDVEIHEVVAAASKNQYLFQAIRDIRLRLAPGLDLMSRTLTRRRESHSGHAQLLEALERHDAAATAFAMKSHLEATRRAIAGALSDKGIDMEAGLAPSVAPAGSAMKSEPSSPRSNAG